MALPIPSDNERCTHTTADGKRCRSYRLPGDETQTLCFVHFTAADAKRYPHEIVNGTSEILSPRDRFDTPRGVNRVLARVMRLLAEGRISPRNALALGYLGQLILNSLPLIASESARKEAQKEAPAMGAEVLAGFQAVLQSLQEPSAPSGSSAVKASDPGDNP